MKVLKLTRISIPNLNNRNNTIIIPIILSASVFLDFFSKFLLKRDLLILFFIYQSMFLSRFSDLNRGPTLYERVALPLSYIGLVYRLRDISKEFDYTERDTRSFVTQSVWPPKGELAPRPKNPN